MEKKLYQVEMTMVSKASLKKLLTLHFERTGETIDEEELTLDDILELALDYKIRDIAHRRVNLCRAYTAEQAQAYIVRLNRNDFSTCYSVETYEAEILDAE